jgi:DNA-binding GntR family transcriptional regulator
MARAATRDTNSAERVATELRDLIVTGQLAPGMHIRQEQMAEDLGVSRAPLREALKQLSSEGLVTHLHNSGYVVARLSQEQFDEIYLMRRLLETELIRGLPRVAKSVLARLTELNKLLAEASQTVDLLAMQRHNHEFHFTIFRQSRLDLVVREIERLWHLAMPYHLLYLYDSAARDRIVKEHASIIRAMRAGDNERLVTLMDEHRLGSEHALSLRF